MTISERATTGITEIPIKDRALSERWRLAARHWCDLDHTARQLDETKSSVFAQKVGKIISDDPKMAVTRAEMLVRSSPDWKTYVEAMVTARTDANRAKIDAETLKLMFTEAMQTTAAARDERKMSK